jgi:hypothetical protein
MNCGFHEKYGHICLDCLTRYCPAVTDIVILFHEYVAVHVHFVSHNNVSSWFSIFPSKRVVICPTRILPPVSVDMLGNLTTCVPFVWFAIIVSCFALVAAHAGSGSEVIASRVPPICTAQLGDTFTST